MAPPFQGWKLPAPLLAVKERLLKLPQGGKAFVEVLLALREHGTKILARACEQALEHRAVTAPVILNHVARLVAPPPWCSRKPSPPTVTATMPCGGGLHADQVHPAPEGHASLRHGYRSDRVGGQAAALPAQICIRSKNSRKGIWRGHACLPPFSLSVIPLPGWRHPRRPVTCTAATPQGFHRGHRGGGGSRPPCGPGSSWCGARAGPCFPAAPARCNKRGRGGCG